MAEALFALRAERPSARRGRLLRRRLGAVLVAEDLCGQHRVPAAPGRQRRPGARARRADHSGAARHRADDQGGRGRLRSHSGGGRLYAGVSSEDAAGVGTARQGGRFQGSPSCRTRCSWSASWPVSLFWQHGLEKLFGFAGARPETSLLGIRGIAGILEALAGRCSQSALCTRPTAFLLSGEMAVAYFRAWAPRGVFPIANGGEEATLNAFIFLWLAAAGPGAWSLDALLQKNRAPRALRQRAAALEPHARTRPAPCRRAAAHAARRSEALRRAAVGRRSGGRAAPRARLRCRRSRARSRSWPGRCCWSASSSDRRPGSSPSRRCSPTLFVAQPRALWPIRNGGIEALLYAAVMLYFAVAGAGRWSLDDLRTPASRRAAPAAAAPADVIWPALGLSAAPPSAVAMKIAGVRRRVVDPVEQVEHFGAELQIRPRSPRLTFLLNARSTVSRPGARSESRSNAGPERAGGRQGEERGIEVVHDTAARPCRASRPVTASSSDLPDARFGRCVPPVCRPGLIETDQRRERRAAHRADNAPTPATPRRTGST